MQNSKKIVVSIVYTIYVYELKRCKLNIYNEFYQYC